MYWIMRRTERSYQRTGHRVCKPCRRPRNIWQRTLLEAMEETRRKKNNSHQFDRIYATPVHSMLKPYRKLADVIEASGLDYTILRPTWFSNADEVNYELTKKGEPEKGSIISQKSIAAFIIKLIEAPEQYSRQNLGINKPNS